MSVTSYFLLLFRALSRFFYFFPPDLTWHTRGNDSFLCSSLSPPQLCNITSPFKISIKPQPPLQVPVQEFSVRSDSGCGSTIGPIIATLSGILTVDCGSPQFSMHSIREMMGSEDPYNGYAHLKSTLVHHPDMNVAIDDA